MKRHEITMHTERDFMPPKLKHAPRKGGTASQCGTFGSLNARVINTHPQCFHRVARDLLPPPGIECPPEGMQKRFLAAPVNLLSPVHRLR